MYEQLKSYLLKFNVDLNSTLWEDILKKSRVIEYKKNEIIVPAGSTKAFAYFVASGSIVMSIVTEVGKCRPVWFHFEDSFRVAVCPESYFKNQQTKFELKALEETIVIRFNKDSIEDWAKQDEHFNQFYYDDVFTTMLAINDIRAVMLSHTPLQLMEYMDEKHPHFVKRISSKNFAHFLGISPEWYSKLKKK